uniref:Uncharacterized protein n=1 Tax=Romanomermis culicivorax TaxID=13658 RepID=A0A915K6H7_ROMCU
MPKTTGYVRVVASYRPRAGTSVLWAHFAAQGPPPGIPTYSALEIISQMESMNLLVLGAGRWVQGLNAGLRDDRESGYSSPKRIRCGGLGNTGLRVMIPKRFSRRPQGVLDQLATG